MRNPAAQGRCDANQAELTAVYESLFCSVVDTHILGGGMGDALIGCAGVTDIVEFKLPDGTYTPAQLTFRKSWRGSKILTIRTREDVIAHVTKIRSRFSQGI
jgi:hypothetical protein